MAFEQYYTHEWKSIPTAATDSEALNGCFDCNICLDFAHEPVVTLCGHLYCWPCIYKWLHFQSTSLASDEHPQCPVCKADICHTRMVPLYGRGSQSSSEPEQEAKFPYLGIPIPPRPAAFGTNALTTAPHTSQQLPYRNPYQTLHYYAHTLGNYGDDPLSPLSNLRGTSASAVFHPSAGVFGEMIYARAFGNAESMYAYPNSYHLMGSSTPRLRRQEMQADKSLNRISIFLFCCFILCLIVF